MSIKKIITFCFLLWCFINDCNGQKIDTSSITIQFEHQTLPNALRQLTDASGISIIFNPDFFDQSTIQKSFIDRGFEYILNQILGQTDVKHIASRSNYILQKKDFYHLYGYVQNGANGERLPFASIVCHSNENGYAANEEGYFNIQLLEGEHKFSIYYVGYAVKNITLKLDENKRADIQLYNENKLPEISIKDLRQEVTDLKNEKYNFRKNDLVELSKNTPNIGGGSDLLHVTRSLAGVQSGAGGVGGYYVRGGDNDQNLFLLDGVPIYHPYHTLGLSSIFLPKTVQSFKIYKSGIPAQYGDRSSAVFDIRLKDGNNKKLSWDFEINTENILLNFETPLKKNRSSLFISGRMATFGYQYNKILKNSLTVADESFSGSEDPSFGKNYQDFIAKYSTKLGEKHKVFLSFYQGNDKIEREEFIDFEIEPGDELDPNAISGKSGLETPSSLQWGNRIFNTRLQSILSPNIFMQTAISANNYQTQNNIFVLMFIHGFQESSDFRGLSSNNTEYALNNTIDINIKDNHRLVGGLNLLLRNNESTLVDTSGFGAERTIEKWYDEGIKKSFRSFNLTSFAESTNNWGKWLLQLGMRSTYFYSQGKSYFHLHPRIYIAHTLNNKSSFSLSFNRTVQYIHNLSSSNLTLPQDLWIPSNEEVQPEGTIQFAMDYSHQFSKYFHWRSELYYKNTKNKTLKNSLNLFANNWESNFTDIQQGTARSFGFENTLFVDYSKWNFQLSYALSKSQLKYEGVNRSKFYPFQLDRRHEVKLVGFYEISPKFTIGINSYMGSGNPYVTVTKFLKFNTLINVEINPDAKNSLRNKLQHRLDASLIYQFDKRQLQHIFKVNLYNIYNSSAPLFYFVKDPSQPIQEDLLVPNFSIPFVPALSYNLRF